MTDHPQVVHISDVPLLFHQHNTLNCVVLTHWDHTMKLNTRIVKGQVLYLPCSFTGTHEVCLYD